MATLEQIQEAYANPNARKFLDFIAQAEGVKHGYNTLFGNQQFGNLEAHPNIRKAFKQTDGTTNYTTAAGRYQFLKGTWDGLARQYGFRDFSPQSQDLGAMALIAGRGALKDVLSGNYKAAINKLGPEWASLPSSQYKQGKRSWDFVNEKLGAEINQRTPVAGKWNDFVGARNQPERMPVLGKWNEFTAQQSTQSSSERMPISGKWQDFVRGG